MRKPILIFYTGGTIGMSATAQGLSPDINFLNRLNFPCESITLMAEEIIDSSAITTRHWKTWLNTLKPYVDKVRGIIVLHGTDTLAYSAAFFAQLNWRIPVVFTGAQKTWDEVHSDAPRNLQAAFSVIEAGFQSVGLVFEHTLFNPQDCRKFSTHDDHGFVSVFHAPWGRLSNGTWQMQVSPLKRLSVDWDDFNENLKILSFYLMPGATLNFLTQTLQSTDCDAIIIHSFGHGNTPTPPDFIDAVRAFNAKGGIVANISQVWSGQAWARYAQNAILAQTGVITVRQSTPENLLAYLNWILSQNIDIESKRKQLADL